MITGEMMKKVRTGARVRVHEGKGKSVFEGIVIARKHGSESGSTITVRGVVASVGVEKTFPLHAPTITKIDILSSPKKVHRSKLYFVRKISGSRIRQKLGVSL